MTNFLYGLSCTLLFVATLIMISSCNSDQEESECLLCECCNTSHTNTGLSMGINYYVPNIFSPNSDGVNDYFGVYPKDELESVGFSIFKENNLIAFQDSSTNQKYWFGIKNNDNGEIHEGLFTYEFYVQSSQGNDTIRGTACAFICIPEEGDEPDFFSCSWPTQHDGDGGFDPGLSSSEIPENCP